MNIGQRIKSLRGKNPDSVLRAPLSNTTQTETLRGLIFGKPDRADDMAFAGLTVGDLIYDVSRVDPLVLSAFDFARTDDLSDVFRFAPFSERIKNLDEAAYMGNIAQLQGYVGERLVAQNLQSMGHEVEFPTGPSQEGYDLLVNGDPFQVKCLAEPQGVYEHLERYPDIPVFVNGDLASELEGLENVIPVPSVTHAEVVEATESSIDAGCEVLDFEIPLLAFSVASGKNIHALVQKKTDFISAMKNISIDTAGRTVMGTIGSKTLALAGLILGPHGVIIGGVIGAAVGASQGKRMTSWLTAKLFCSREEDSVEVALKDLLTASYLKTQKKLAVIRTKSLAMEKALARGGTLSKVLWKDFSWRLQQEIEYCSDKVLRMKRFASEPQLLLPSNNDIFVATTEAMHLIAQAGIMAYNVRPQMEELRKAVEQYKKTRERFLLQ